MKFDDNDLGRIRIHLLDEGSDKLIRFMQHKSLSWDVSNFDPETVQTARDLNWITGPDNQLSDLGYCAADSCREFQFWQERDRKLPFEDDAPHLSRAHFKGRSVVEIGSGMGANLMSLSDVATQVSGVEPIEAYAQLGRILSERAGLTPLETLQGSAENLPFDDNAADFLLCVSAHQYFDIKPAFTEIARVLKPGGELIIIGGTFKGYLRDGLRDLMQRPGGTKAFIITIINTLGYMFFNRRLIRGRGEFSTSRPIYPTRRAMRRWLADAGMEEISPPCRVGPETCFHVRQI